MTSIMLDSGAYSAFRQGKSVDLAGYIRFVKWVATKTKGVEVIPVVLDVIGDGEASFNNWRGMQDAGLNPLPVYHVTTDIYWLKCYLDECDYIGVGAIANLSSDRRILALDRIWHEYLLDEDQMPKVKVHGMGIAGFRLLGRYPWYSIDTTSWVLVAGYGGIFFPLKIGGEWCYSKIPGKIFISSSSPAKSFTGKHYDTLPPAEQAEVVEYLESIGENLEEVKDDWKARARVNVYVYHRFVEALGGWRRRCEAKKVETLWTK